MRIIPPAVVIIAALLASCATRQSPWTIAPAPGVKIGSGTIVQISSGHGNAYTSISSDQCNSIGLKPRMLIHVAFDDTAMILMVGSDYADVPSGTPLAVLHREGLTFAIRDGNFSATYGIAVGAQFTISTVPLE